MLFFSILYYRRKRQSRHEHSGHIKTRNHAPGSVGASFLAHHEKAKSEWDAHGIEELPSPVPEHQISVLGLAQRPLSELPSPVAELEGG